MRRAGWREQALADGAPHCVARPLAGRPPRAHLELDGAAHGLRARRWRRGRRRKGRWGSPSPGDLELGDEAALAALADTPLLDRAGPGADADTNADARLRMCPRAESLV
jgi:hypothetical protein